MSGTNREEAISRRAAVGRTTAAAFALTLPGALFAQREPAADQAPVRPYLDAAKQAMRWITTTRIVDARGARWPVAPDKSADVQLDLYSGTPGVVLFLLEMYAATRDTRALADAVLGADFLIASLPAASAPITGEGAGLYTGLAGTAYVLERTFDATREDKYLRAAQQIVRTLLTAERKDTPGGWNESNDIVSGTAGIGLTMLWAAKTFGDAEARDAAIRAGQTLVRAGLPQPVGIKWEIQPGFRKRYPNFSHGTAGVAFFLARLFGETGDTLFRDVAVSGAKYLQSIAVSTTSDGRKIMHSEPGGEELFYMSWCHGPAGTARLFHQLGRVAHNPDFSQYVDALARGISDSGVPETHPDLSGFWNNISQCCGNCGVSEFFIAQYRRTRERTDLAFAQRVCDDTISRATAVGDGLKWIQAENRTAPTEVVAQTGLMQGAAGVGLALLHLDGALRRRPAAVVLPDSPDW